MWRAPATSGQRSSGSCHRLTLVIAYGFLGVSTSRQRSRCCAARGDSRSRRRRRAGVSRIWRRPRAARRSSRPILRVSASPCATARRGSSCRTATSRRWRHPWTRWRRTSVWLLAWVDGRANSRKRSRGSARQRKPSGTSSGFLPRNRDDASVTATLRVGGLFEQLRELLELVDGAGRSAVSILRPPPKTTRICTRIDPCLGHPFAPEPALPRLLAAVYGVGLLLIRQSGMGKSECVLDLVKRGPRILADALVL